MHNVLLVNARSTFRVCLHLLPIDVIPRLSNPLDHYSARLVPGSPHRRTQLLDHGMARFDVKTEKVRPPAAVVIEGIVI